MSQFANSISPSWIGVNEFFGLPRHFRFVLNSWIIPPIVNLDICYLNYKVHWHGSYGEITCAPERFVAYCRHVRPLVHPIFPGPEWILIQSVSCICPRIKVTLTGALRLLLTGEANLQPTENKCAVALCICHKILPLELFQRAMKIFSFQLCAFDRIKEGIVDKN